MTLIGVNRSIILPASVYEFLETTRDLDNVPRESRRRGHRRALSNPFGFGGQSTCLWIGGYDE
jgi:3-oxoacyl-(acyl-carrier-protein) synthase